MSTPDFERAIETVKEFEGGLSNDKFDRGGLTKYGISQRAYPNTDIESLTWADAKEIYYQDYWCKVRGDDLPYRLALIALDTAVNAGPGQAIRQMQKALGVKADGRIGPITLRAAQRSADDPTKLVNVAAERACHFARICIKDPTQQRFLKGWMRRAISVAATASRARKHE